MLWAIATSGALESARPTLALLEISAGAVVITRDMVEHAKPDPDLFVAAARRLRVPIGTSVVVGDSVWDLLAAQRAGALGVGVLSGGYGQDELERAGAYRVYQPTVSPRRAVLMENQLNVRLRRCAQELWAI